MTEPSTSNDWIDQFLTRDPPRAKSLVMTLFGDAIVPHGARLWRETLKALKALYILFFLIKLKTLEAI